MPEVTEPTESPEKSRIPDSVADIQVNFCKNPSCGHFSVPASTETQPRGRPTQGASRDRYTITGTDSGPQLRCNYCKEHLPVKSNLGIVEELQRLSVPLAEPVTPGCKTAGCENIGFPAAAFPDRYWSYGKTKAGTPRYRCKSCKATVTGAGHPLLRQRKSHVNSEVFRAIAQKMPFSCVAEFARISPSTFYRKFDFIHHQCLLFAANRERRLASMRFDRLYLCVDRMDHIINWSNRKDKRNIALQAVGTADLKSGFVLALHANYDSTASRDDVTLEAIDCGDHLKQPPFRRHARYWLPAEYEAAVKVAGNELPSGRWMSSLDSWIDAVYAAAVARGDIEQPDNPKKVWQPPGSGLLVHAEYTLYAHFFYLKRLLPDVGKYRFFLDQESGIRAACLAAFADEVMRKDCDAFYVSIKKGVPKERVLALIAESQQKLQDFAETRARLPSVAGPAAPLPEGDDVGVADREGEVGRPLAGIPLSEHERAGEADLLPDKPEVGQLRLR